MIRLKIICYVENQHEFKLAQQIFFIGHSLAIITNNIFIQEQCEELGITWAAEKAPLKDPHLIIIFNKSFPINRDYNCFLLNSSAKFHHIEKYKDSVINIKWLYSHKSLFYEIGPSINTYIHNIEKALEYLYSYFLDSLIIISRSSSLPNSALMLKFFEPPEENESHFADNLIINNQYSLVETKSFNCISEKKRLLSCLYDLLDSYKSLMDDEIVIGDNNFNYYPNLLCDIQRFNKDKFIKLDPTILRVILPNIINYEDNVAEIERMIEVDFDEEKITIHNFQDGYENFLNHLENLFVNFDKKVYLSAEEQKIILDEYNKPSENFDVNHSIDQLYTAFSKANPDKIVLVDELGQISYQNLELLSNGLAHAIEQAVGDAYNKRIAVSLPKSRTLIASILGILKSGAAYIPIDSAYPSQRIKNILEEASPELVICDQQFYNNHYDILDNYKRLIIENHTLLEQADYSRRSKSTNLAYIIFTSGSTGKPKGVMIEHKSVVNLSQGARIACNINAKSRILCIASLGFDAIGWDIYGAILNGATLYLAPEGIQTRPDELVEYINSHQITFMTLTPAVLSLLPLQNLDSLETVIVMGDKCPKALMDKWSQKVSLFNGYGPTEATIGTTICAYNSDLKENCIGRPLVNYYVYILDSKIRPLPIGKVGELHIAGIGLARGYLDHELTDQKFFYLNLPNHKELIRVYKSGDLASWSSEGKIEFHGRIDRQIKIRGVRIEIGEVEALINQYKGVKESLVLSVEEDTNQKLIAYVVPETNAAKNLDVILKEYLTDCLHPAAVPDFICMIPEFRLNFNGKVDISALPPPNKMRFSTNEACIGPRNDEERIIKQIFTEVLGHQHEIGIYQSLFSVGGHSLTATQICTRINKALGTNFLTKDIFENNNIADLARLVPDKKITKALSVPSSQQLRESLLTSAQERLWYLNQLDHSDTSYNLAIALKLCGLLDYNLLSQSIEYIMARHETFRTIFKNREGIPYQIVLPKFNLSMAKERVTNLEEQMKEFCQTIFKLDQEPPVRVKLYVINPNEHVLLFVKHNIITDAWSEGVVIKELFKTYQSLQKDGALPVLPQIEYQCVDIAQHYHNYEKFKDNSLSVDFWQKNLRNAQEVSFPLDYDRPDIINHKGKKIIYDFSHLPWGDLCYLASQYDCTPFMLVIAVLNILLHKYTNANEIIIGTAIAQRQHPYMEYATGFFVDTLPIKTSFDPNINFKDFLLLIRQNCFDVYRHQNIPFEKIVEITKVKRHLNKNPLFQIMAVLQNADEGISAEIDQMQIEKLTIQTGKTMFDMVWNFRENHARNLSLELDFSTELYKENTILRIIKNYEHILQSILKNPNILISKIISISEQEQQVIKNSTYGPLAPLKYSSIVEWIEFSLANYSDNIAIIDGDDITYNKLYHMIKTVCSLLRTKTTKGTRIGILLNRSHKLIVALLSALRSGCIYVPLDPDYPLERLQYMVRDADISILITEDNLYELGKILYKDTILNIDKISPKSPDSEEDCANFSASDLAYILYTSGSTGQPKGVMISHINLVNFCQDMIQRLCFKEEDKFLSITTVSFDIFCLEYLCTLLSGGTLFICENNIARNPVALVNYFNTIIPTKMQATPTMWSMIIEHILPCKGFTALCGGEAWPGSLLQKFQSKNINIWNLYGPTETTIWSTAANLSSQTTVNIGVPIMNTGCHILDDNWNPVPLGVYGKLFITGPGLSSGYWNKPELSKKFFHLHNNTVFYETGDLAKISEDGYFVCGGRADNQIKIRGHRIELGDIESHISSHEGVQKVICNLDSTNSASEPRVFAYIIPKQKHNPPADLELRKFLEDKIPSAAIPANFIILDKFPLTSNNKIDRKKLPISFELLGYSEGKYVAPRNVFEEKIQIIWTEILKIKQISVKESFFSLGGNSLHIPQIVSRINSEFNTQMTIRNFILNSTICALASFVQPAISKAS